MDAAWRLVREPVVPRFKVREIAYPVEVAPLVADIRTLLGRNRDIAERGRRQAADLAHALKTPRRSCAMNWTCWRGRGWTWRTRRSRWAAPVPGGVALSVEDDGPGIAKAAREGALRPGARLDVSMPGSGLGLMIVNDLVSAYGGAVELGVADALEGLSVRVMVPNRLIPGGPSSAA